MKSRTKQETIINKLKPCGCGCNGSDPWHRSEYKRVVTADSNDATTGTVKMPFSTQPVRVTRSRYERDNGTDFFGVWVVDRDSIVYDK